MSLEPLGAHAASADGLADVPAAFGDARPVHAHPDVVPGAWRLWGWLLLWTVLLVAVVAVPVLLLHPFRPQSPLQVALAFQMRKLSPLVTAVGLLFVGPLAFRLARGRRLRWQWLPLLLVLPLCGAAGWFAHQNHFEWMFAPAPLVRFEPAAAVDFLGGDDMVLAVERGADRAAYPVRQLAYHHLVQDTVAGTPVVATYCTLCHTGLVWESTVDGRVLTFHLYGINNQNMLMRDRETGTWWQQSTGEAIQGPLRGRRLASVVHSEVTFAVFRGENPGGRVLRPAAGFERYYAPANWERRMKKAPTVTPRAAGDTWEPRTHVVGVHHAGRARAYAFPSIRRGGPVNDKVGPLPVLVVVGDDRKSVRVFERTLDGRPLEFVARAGVWPLRLADLETGSEWDFSGQAVSGPLRGRRLRPVWSSKQYWFDWKLRQPHTTLYSRPAVDDDAL